MKVNNTYTEEELAHVLKELEKVSFGSEKKESDKNKKELIVEDVIYYAENGDKFVSTAKETFYYQFLMRRASATPMEKKKKKAAEDFEKYQLIFLYLMEKGYLTNTDYCIDFDPIQGGACFSIDLARLLEEVELENDLNKHFEGQHLDEYIKTFCHPVESLRCIYCGSFSFSRFIKDDYFGRDEPCCLACHPLSNELKGKIKEEYAKSGSMAAVVKRLELIEEYSKVQIPEGKSINSLIADYKATYKTDIEDVGVSEIRNILNELGLESYDVFSTGDYDILLLNMEALADINTFSECVGVEEEDAEILVFFEKEGAVWINDNAVKFAKSLIKSNYKEV